MKRNATEIKAPAKGRGRPPAIPAGSDLQTELVELMLDGASTRQIAAKLGISQDTAWRTGRLDAVQQQLAEGLRRRREEQARLAGHVLGQALGRLSEEALTGEIKYATVHAVVSLAGLGGGLAVDEPGPANPSTGLPALAAIFGPLLKKEASRSAAPAALRKKAGARKPRKGTKP